MTPPDPSPPKRVTRARAKAADSDTTKPNSTKATTTKAKVTAPATKSKAKVEEENDNDQLEEPEVKSEPKPLAKKPAPRKTAANAARTKALGTADASKSTKPTRLTTAKRAAKQKPESGSAPTTSDAATNVVEKPKARALRNRNVSVSEETPEMDQTQEDGPCKKAVQRKKVTFAEDDSEKENAVMAEPPKKRGAAAAKTAQTSEKSKAGAKPARGTSTRGKGSLRGGRAQRNAPRPEPLSPKKNAQVSVPQDEEDEDVIELDSGKPEKQLQKSPVKPATLSIHRVGSTSPSKAQQQGEFGGSVDELQGSTAIFNSPAKKPTFSIHSSPEKPAAPPPTLTLQQSPKKFGDNTTQVPSTTVKPAVNESGMSKPARKFPMSAPPKQPVFDPAKQPQGQQQNSMFMSPAKRPGSPIKELRFGSAVKPTATPSLNKSVLASGVSGTPRKLFSPVKASSAFKAAKSPAAAMKVHRMTDEEQARMLEDELVNAPSPYSPSKASVRPITPPKSSKIPVRSPPRSAEKSTLVQEQAADGVEADEDILGPSTIEEEPKTAKSSPVKERNPVQRTPFRMMRDDHAQESDDELSYDSPASNDTPFARRHAGGSFGSTSVTTPKFSSNIPSDGPMTALANRFNAWQGASPNKEVIEQRKAEGNIFSPPYVLQSSPSFAAPLMDSDMRSTEPQNSFEEAIAIHEDEDIIMEDADNSPQEEPNFRQSQMSDASQEYGDENAVPIDLMLLHQFQGRQSGVSCTPARLINAPSWALHTVSKVPLKPAAEDDSPRRKPARRGHSLSTNLSPHAQLELGLLRQCHPLAPSFEKHCSEPNLEQPARASNFVEMLDDETEQPSTPTPATPSANTGISTAAATPARTPRPGLNTSLLAGVVVFVDVHTTEGADASEIFVELLTQMGARCVKHWAWNPRGSFEGTHSAGDLEEASSSKVGITHVVFKDGGKRTMEKVREAKGLVMCVGVGWVLDCEKENEWLSEAEYAIDTATIPRGGHRRRKSMEPKSLSNSTFSPSKTPISTMSPTKEYLNLGTPTPRRETVQFPANDDQRISSPNLPPPADSSANATPVKATDLQTAAEEGMTPSNHDDGAMSSFGSPATPYFFHPQDIVQQTCPPKQTQHLFFPPSGRIEDEPNEGMRAKLTVARRKSLQWAPRTSSPLARAYSYQ